MLIVLIEAPANAIDVDRVLSPEFRLLINENPSFSPASVCWGNWGDGGFRVTGIEEYVASIRTVINVRSAIVGLSSDNSSPQKVGVTVTFTVTASDPEGDQAQLGSGGGRMVHKVLLRICCSRVRMVGRR
jgi:hypothetical protein